LLFPVPPVPGVAHQINPLPQCRSNQPGDDE
jgi:hypothetical protein